MVAREQKPSKPCYVLKVHDCIIEGGKREIVLVTYYASHATNIHKMHQPDVSQSIPFWVY